MKRNIGIFCLFWIFSAGFSSMATITKSSTYSDTLVEGLMKRAQYKSALTEISKHLALNHKNTSDQRLYYTNKLALSQMRSGNIDSAMINARVSISLISTSHDSALISEAWKVASYSYNVGGKLDSALIFIRLLYQYALRHNDERQMRNSLTSIGAIQAQNRKFSEALEQYKKAKILTHQLKDSANYGTGDFNIGLTFLNLQMHDSCILYLTKALGYSKRLNLPDQLVYIYGTLADCYLGLKNDRERKRYLLLANGEAEKTGNKQFLAMGYSNLTDGALRENNYNEAILYGVKALEMLKEQPYPVLKMKIDSMLYLSYKGKGNMDKALVYLETFTEEREEFHTLKQDQILEQLTMTLKVREKDLTIANQQLEITSKKRKIEVLSLILIVIVLILIGLLIYVILTREFQRQLFRKEKELDQLNTDVQNWLAWKAEQSAIDEKGMDDQNSHEHSVMKHDPGTAQLALFNELRDIFSTQKLYLDPELNLKMVVKLLGTNKKYLSQALSGNSDENFRSFINRYRIDEAKRIMEHMILEEKEVNFQELTTMSGFNSVVSFYRAFKSLTGLTPNTYLREIKASLRDRQAK